MNNNLSDEERLSFYHGEKRRISGRWERIQWIITKERKKKIAQGRLESLSMELYKNAVWSYIHGLYRSTQLCISSGLEAVFRSLVFEGEKYRKLYDLTEATLKETWINQETHDRVQIWRKEVRNELSHGKKHVYLYELHTILGNDNQMTSVSTVESAKQGIELFQDVVNDVFTRLRKDQSPKKGFWEIIRDLHANSKDPDAELLKHLDFFSNSLGELVDQRGIHPLRQIVSVSPPFDRELIGDLVYRLQRISIVPGNKSLLGEWKATDTHQLANLKLNILLMMIGEDFIVQYNDEDIIIKEELYSRKIRCLQFQGDLIHEEFHTFTMQVNSAGLGYQVRLAGELYEQEESEIYQEFLNSLVREIEISSELNQMKKIHIEGVGNVTIQPKSIDVELLQQGFRYNYLDVTPLISRILSNLESFDGSTFNGWLIIDLTKEYIDILQWSKDHETEIIRFLKSSTRVNGLVLTTLHSPYFHKVKSFTSETNNDQTMYFFGYETNAWSIDKAVIFVLSGDDPVLEAFKNYKKNLEIAKSD